MGIMSVGSDVIDRLLVKYSALMWGWEDSEVRWDSIHLLQTGKEVFRSGTRDCRVTFPLNFEYPQNKLLLNKAYVAWK
jgi:hypothetical protein